MDRGRPRKPIAPASTVLDRASPGNRKAGLRIAWDKAELGKAGIGGRRVVHYVMTKAGPEPVGKATAPLDYEHYVTQQLRPIADALLRFVRGPDFDDLTGAQKQLSLFSR